MGCVSKRWSGCAIWRRHGDDEGQMAVELVALIPVMLVVAGVAANLIGYMGLCSRFDRVAAEAVRVYGVSPGYGEYGGESCAGSIETALAEAFEDVDSVDVEVASEDIGSLSGNEIEEDGLVYSFIPSFRRYTCTLSYDPVFFASGAFGFEFPELEHENSYVVDPYEPGGWM